MLKDRQRLCDVCKDEIPKGAKYRRAHVAPDQAQLFDAMVDAIASSDPDMKFTWTENEDGSRTVDICLECTLSMGDIPAKEEMN